MLMYLSYRPFDSFDARLLAVRANVNDFLLKPINITTLVSKIRKNFKNWF